MAAINSALSLAAEAIAAGLAQHFVDPAKPKVSVVVDTPVGANGRIKNNSDTSFINLFFYRVATSGAYAAHSNRDPLLLRAYCLVTPFSVPPAEGEEDKHVDLAILGEAIRFFHDRTLFETALQNPGPGNGASPGTKYRLECTLLQPSMEEINHIWTTQGDSLPYRLSAAYEFSLIPMEPLVVPEPPANIRTLMLDIAPSPKPPSLGRFGAELRGIPIKGLDDAKPPKGSWLPVVMLRDNCTLTNMRAVADGATEVSVALAGLPGALAALELAFLKADGTATGALDTRYTPIRTALLDDEDALVPLAFVNPGDAEKLTIRARPATVVGGNNAVEANAPYTHTLTVTFGGGS